MNNELTSRNLGYISHLTQEKITQTHILIAGCGIGSQVALALSRMGFRQFTLIDGDRVSHTNLNRQGYYFDQIGLNKSKALAANLKRINPEVRVKVCDYHFDHQHEDVMDPTDVVIDTIDFLDLKSILMLHEAAERRKKPLISGMSVGWGSCGIYFSNAAGRSQQFRKIFDITENDHETMSYVLKFSQLFEKIKGMIDPTVVQVMQDTFMKLANNQPCPAPQVVGGSLNLASLISSLLYQHVNGDKVPECPYLVISDMTRTIQTSQFDLSQF